MNSNFTSPANSSGVCGSSGVDIATVEFWEWHLVMTLVEWAVLFVAWLLSKMLLVVIDKCRDQQTRPGPSEAAESGKLAQPGQQQQTARTGPLTARLQTEFDEWKCRRELEKFMKHRKKEQRRALAIQTGAHSRNESVDSGRNYLEPSAMRNEPSTPRMLHSHVGAQFEYPIHSMHMRAVELNVSRDSGEEAMETPKVANNSESSSSADEDERDIREKFQHNEHSPLP